MTTESIQTVDVSKLSLETLMMDNPVLIKHIRSRLRKQQIIPSLVVVLIIAALMTWSCFKLDQVHNGVAFSIIASLQGAILYLAGTSQVATAVAQARETGILDFHRVSPLRSLTVTLGFTLGAPIREWVLFAALLPFSLACVGGGNPDALGWLKALAALIVSGLLFHAAGGLVGATTKPRSAGSVAVGIVILLFFLSGVFWRFTPGPAIAEVIGQGRDIPLSNRFFGFEFSQLALGLFHQIPLMIFLFIATVRKIRRERAFVYSKPVAMVFLAMVGLFLLGDTHTWNLDKMIFRGFTPAFTAYFMTIAGLLLITAVTPGWGDFANGIRRARKAGQARPAATADFASNLLPVAVCSLFVLATPVLSHLMRHAPHDFLRAAILSGVVAACAVLLFGCAQQTFELTYRKASKTYFALFLFIVWIVPLLLGAAAGITGLGERVVGYVLAMSPLAGIGLVAGALDEPGFKAEHIPWVAVGVSAATAILFVILSGIAARKAEGEAVALR